MNQPPETWDPAHPGSSPPAGHAPPAWDPAQPGQTTSAWDPTRAAPAGGYAAPPGGYAGRPAYGGYPPAKPVAPGGAPLAEFWQRLVAYFVDALIISAVIAVPLIIVIVVAAMTMAQTTPDPFAIVLVEIVAAAFVFPMQVAVTYVYFVVMFYKTGQTVGKRVMKIRVIRASDGGPLDVRIARRRWLVQHVAGLIAFYFPYADGLWQLWDQPYRQCLHDKCAETVVVQVTP